MFLHEAIFVLIVAISNREKEGSGNAAFFLPVALSLFREKRYAPGNATCLVTPVAIAAATAIATAITTTAAATTAALEATGTWLTALVRLVDNDRATIECGIVELTDGVLRLLIVAHFYKAKAFAASRLAINDHCRGNDLSQLSEDIGKVLVCCAVWQSANV
jgi:hypothetical protein